jgi:hypothetical protein
LPARVRPFSELLISNCAVFYCVPGTGDADIDPVGNEAFWLIERLALALIDEENESAAKAGVLRAVLAFAHEQSKTLDKLRGYHEFTWPRPSPTDFQASSSAPGRNDADSRGRTYDLAPGAQQAKPADV